MLATSTAQTSKPQVLTPLLATVAKGQCCKLSSLAADLHQQQQTSKPYWGRRPCSPDSDQLTDCFLCHVELEDGPLASFSVA